VSRDSRLRVATAFLSKGAIAARSLGLHKLVNGLKSFGLHKKLETQNDDAEKDRLRTQAAQAVADIMPQTLRFYDDL